MATAPELLIERCLQRASAFAEGFNFAIEAITTLGVVRAAKTI